MCIKGWGCWRACIVAVMFCIKCQRATSPLPERVIYCIGTNLSVFVRQQAFPGVFHLDLHTSAVLCMPLPVFEGSCCLIRHCLAGLQLGLDALTKQGCDYFASNLKAW